MYRRTFIMKKRNVVITGLFAVLLSITLLVVNSGKYHAITLDELDPKEQLQIQVIGWKQANEGIEAAFEYVQECGGTISPRVIQLTIDLGYWGNHVEELKAMGYTSVDYSAVTGSSNTATPAQTQPAEPVKTPEPFTVEAYNPAKTMWATDEVNCREGSSTDYSKVGGLKKHEQVNVTVVASTGWYQITKEDGTVMYVSNKYLTEEDPTSQTVYQYDEEDGVVETITVTGENAEDVDKVVAEITATPEPTLEPTPEPTEEPTPVPTPEPTAEPVIEEPVQTINYWYIAGAAFALVVLIVGIVMVMKSKKK